MPVLDIVLAILILIGLVRGFIKGLFVEVASVVALIAGVYGAIHFSNFASDILQTRTEWNEKTINITAFAITFVVIVFAIALAGKALTKLADFAALGILNKVLGALFGALKVVLVLSVILNIFEKVNTPLSLIDETEVESSVLYVPVKSLVSKIFPNLLNLNPEAIEEDEKEA